MTDEDAPPEPNVDPNYLSHLHQHTQQTHLHLQGHDPSAPLPPFYTESPKSHWTSAEKSAFFHALSIHSRLRPDLIAERVKTKNVVDVCAYMDMLEDGVRREGNGVNRSEVEAAMEVSEKWIELEEEKAAAIIGHEMEWKEQATKIAREEELKLKKMETMPKARRGEAKSRDERKHERVQLTALRKSQKLQWNVEDAMRSLGTVHFKVIDNILRGQEETLPAAATTSRQSTMEPPPVDPDEEMIDPVLRSKSKPTPGPSTSIASVGPESSIIPEDLSPKSRRRLRKRLYMRRKRAEATGSTDLLPAEPFADILRFKPGRKSNPRKKQKTEKGSVVVGDENQDEEHDDDSDDPRHPNIGGKTRRYKIKDLLESIGMNAGALHQNGLGLFHLSALSKLMRMYNLLHDVPPNVSTEITIDAIQFLHAHVVRYVTELVHRAIVSREQERDMKSHTKVWRFNSEQILPATIEHAIEMVGTTSIGTKESVLAGVFERLGVPSEDVDSDEQDDAPAGDQTDEEGLAATSGHVDQRGIISSTFSLHQGMYAPLVRLSPILGAFKAPYIYESYQRTSASISVELEDPLLPLDIDEAALSAELHQEEELDAQDRIAAEQYENVLWGEYSHRSRQVAIPEEVWDGHGHELRFKPPGIDGRVKSQVFVADSDSE